MPQLCERLFETPGAIRFIEYVQDDLTARNCVVILVPAPLDPNVLSLAILSQLGQKFDMHEVDLSTLCSSRPIDALARYAERMFGLTDNPRTVPAMVTSSNMPDALVLNGIHLIDADHQKLWFELIVQWSNCLPAARTQLRQPPSLVIIAHLPDLKVKAPPSELYLKTRVWWGIPSVFDVRMLCRLEEVGGESQLETVWRENIIPAMVGTDLDFASFLWEHVTLSIEAILGRCAEYASIRGWSADLLNNWRCDEVAERAYRDPELRDRAADYSTDPSWSRGALTYTADGRMQVHAAALCELGQNSAILNRIWSGQVALALSAVETLRLHVCRDVTRAYGPGWPSRWEFPQTDWELRVQDANSTECEISHLKSVLHVPAVAQKRHYLPAVKQGSWIRNKIAHGVPITYSDFKQLIELTYQCT